MELHTCFITLSSDSVLSTPFIDGGKRFQYDKIIFVCYRLETIDVPQMYIIDILLMTVLGLLQCFSARLLLN